ncbi:MAG: 30S ribosomal protein S20 [candidate division Zixibacteria bacterium]
MPTHKSAAKRMKTSDEARRRNRHAKSSIRSAIKILDAEEDPQKIADHVKAATSVVDKAARKKVISKNKAARIKSRLSKQAKS